eukprot:TRINITY_DN40473_c0_g1_i1.p2 TRINITY_DN40473_c0_g1~~TRINITY_DN40473_c0_g1_i1.p2  ORF type:complete len:382 (+),score=89.91 TRINITY_DN40473_c0_g1_i1:76-1221(+)
MRRCQRLLRHSVLYFGSEGISLRCLRPIAEDARGARRICRHLEVVAPPPYARRETDLRRFATDVGITCHTPADPRTLRGWQCPAGPDGDGMWDVGVVVSFRYFLPKAVLSRFRKGCINVHPSLLPRYRGSSPMQHTLLNADRIGGTSVIKIVPGEHMDHGDVLARREMDVPWDMRWADFHEAASGLSAELLAECLDGLEERWAAAGPQPNRVPKADDPHFAPLIDRSTHCRVSFASSAAGTVYHQWRAMEGEGGVYTTFNRCTVPTAAKRPRSSEPARVGLADIVHPRRFAAEDTAELRRADAAPGSIYFASSLKGARRRSEAGLFYVRCADTDDVDPAEEPIPWVGCRGVHVACEKKKSAVDLLTGYQFRTGVVYPGVLD